MSFSGTKEYPTKPKPGVMLNLLHPLSRGLVGYWLFNEGAGSRVNDISGCGNHGTLTNGSTWGGSKFGGSLEYDGVNDYVDCGNGASLNITDAITIEAWVKTDVSGNYFVNKRSDVSTGFTFFTGGGTGYLMAKIGDGANTYTVRNDVDITDGVWHHLVFALDNRTEAYVYVDGVDDSCVRTGTLANVGDITAVADLYIGKSGNIEFAGLIDVVRIYNRGLLAEEIKMLYHDPFCNLMQVPVRRWYAPPAVGNPFWYYNMLRRRS